MEKIDFVIPWVDGNDKSWQKEKNLWRSKLTGDQAIDDLSLIHI